MSLSPVGSAARRRAPKESRRWLKRQVPRRELYRLSPRPARQRLGHRATWDLLRRWIRAWWIWLAAAAAAHVTGHWIFAASSAALSFVFYQTTPEFHPAFYALDTDLCVDSPEFPMTVAGMTGTSLTEGNAVSIYNNGDEFYPAMLAAVAAATRSVTMEQYIYWDGAIGRQFTDALAAKARDGVSVRLIVDAIGSSTLGEPILKTLEDTGCRLAWFQPIRWYTLDRINHRNHRKSLVIDGRTAFTGGAGIADQWLGSGRTPSSWRDVQVRVDGPAALGLQSGFANNWLNLTGEILSGAAYFPLPEEAGPVTVQTIQSSSGIGATAAGTMHLLAIQCARRSLSIANSYFIPDSRVIDMLARACRRGVKIRLMLAGRHSDTWWARQNSVRLYGRLFEAGVEIYEYSPSMLHQKVMIADGAWATVGTTNFDNRSFALNEETNVCLFDRKSIRALQTTFDADLEHCRRITRARWRRRGVAQRGAELFASLIEDQL